MSVQTKEREFRGFLLVFLGFVLGSPIVLWAAGLFSVELYFTVSFLWLLVASEVFAPSDRESIWWNRLQWVKAGGWIVLAYLVLGRVLAVVQ